MQEIRENDYTYTEEQKNENLPLLLSCTPSTASMAHFKLLFDNVLQHANDFPVLPILLSMVDDIKVIR
jgi:hypothetical protein